MPSPPTGTVTFLFTDIEGSTTLWERYPAETRAALLRHDQLIEQIVDRHGGNVVRPRGEGDSRFAVFTRATDAVAAASGIQHALHNEPWPTPIPLKLRIALHTGEADLRDGDYYGSAVNRCARLRAAAHGGQTLLSQVTCDLVCEALPGGTSLRDLGEHRLKDLQRPEHIFQLVVPDLPCDFPPIKVLDSRPNNLPVQRSELVGRERELEAVQGLLTRQGVGLLTLTGPGGTGKTRLALQVGADLLDDFEAGVFIATLTPLSDPKLVASQIAQVLGVKEAEGKSLAESLKEYVQDKQLLLLLDNFEQVVEAAPLVADLLAVAPRLKILVTSRAVLHLRDEQEFRVPPLQLPDPMRLPSLEQLSHCGAIALFVQRAQLVKADFKLTDENARAVVEICHRLDGLPLALELAAARIRLFPPQAILGRLESRLKFLTGGARDLPAHQQTLRSAVAWSYDLLHPEEQKLFRRISVFVGSFQLEAAEAVCNSLTGSDLEIDFLEGISSLLDKSLLQQEELHGEPRFRVLETIREYGAEMLAACGEQEELQRQHAAFYLDLCQHLMRKLLGPGQQEALERLEAEYGNLRATFAWSLDSETGDPQVALRLCWELLPLWLMLGYFNEGRTWGERAIQAPGAIDKPFYAEALASVGSLASLQGDLVAGRSYQNRAIPIAREQGNRRALGYALMGLAMTITRQEGPENVGPIYEESINLLREVGDKYGLSQALISAAVAAMYLEDFAKVRLFLEESLSLLAKLGFNNTARVLVSLGDLARIEGDYTRARALYEEGLVLIRQVAHKWELPALLHNLGHVAVAQGETEEAQRLFEESLTRHLEMDNKMGIAEALAGFAAIAALRGEWTKSARLFGAVDAMWEAAGVPMWPAERVDWERNVARARALLDEATWQKAWQEGRAMSREDAVAYALEQPSSWPPAEP